MRFWLRSALAFAGAGLLAMLIVPLVFRYAVLSMLSGPLPGPEPKLTTFRVVAEDLRSPSEMATEPDGTFRVDYRANVPPGGDGQAISKTIDTIANDHCLLLIKAFARTCRLETMHSSVRSEPENKASQPTEVFMRFRVTQRID